MKRIEKLQSLANEIGVTVTIKELGGSIFANVNGISFKVQGYTSFVAKCRELKDYQAPELIDLTTRLIKIEEMSMKALDSRRITREVEL